MILSRNLIFTSSPSVIANGKDLNGVDESISYPQHFEAFYPKTKSIAERLVISSHNPGTFNTIALRPHLIFGPGDTNLLPTIIERAKSGKLKQIGDGSNLSDFTFIDDCVAAHLCALKALNVDPSVGGQSYFISQGDPMPLWGVINCVLEASGVSKITKRVPKTLAMLVAALSETLCRLVPALGEPVLTRFLVSEMATSHYFNINAARTKLGFSPRFTVQEALKITFN